MSELQLQKPKGKNKWTLAIITGAVIVMAIAVFLILAGKNETTDYTLIPVSNDGERWGYINRKGEYTINPQFEDAGYFNNGLAKITSADGKTGYINKKGDYVIPATYKSGTFFNDGLAFVVAEGGLPTCIDKKGNTKFVFNAAKYVSAFSEGMAMFVTETGEYGFVDRNGNIVVNAQFDRALPFSGNYARIWQNGDVGFIDKKGSIIINPQFREVGNLSEGKAAFNNGNSWGYIDQKGTYVINPMFDNADQFSDGLAAIKQGRSYGYIDKGGKLVVNPQFDNASSFSDGLAAVQGAGKYGYINRDGKYEINPQFEYAGEFHDGIAMVRSGDKWGFINKKGQYVANPQFKHIKREMSPDEQPDLIESDYFDTSEFITLFFERDAGNTFDGIGGSTTLEQLSEHPVYGAGLNARTSSNADFRQMIPLTTDISISDITFLFENTPIYEYVNEGYHRTQKWNFDATPDAIVYQFDLNGKAWEKRHVVINALKSEIEHRYGQPMDGDDDNYYLIQDNGKHSFIINETKLAVKFGGKSSSSRHNLLDKEQVIKNDVDVPKTSIRTSDDIYYNRPRMTSAERSTLKIDHFKNKEIRTAENSNLVKGDCIYRNHSGALSIIYLIQSGNGNSTGMWDFLVSYDSSGNYIDELIIGGGWIQSELHSTAVIEGNKIVITYYGEEKIPDSIFIINSDLKFVQIK